VLLRPSAEDFRLIGFYAGRVIFGVGLAMLLPAALAAYLGEIDEAHAFLIGAGLAIIAGRLTEALLATRATLTATLGLASVAVAWLVAPVFAGVPLLLSGHYASWLDAYFEAMSGFATIGLTLANDLDHMARSVNLWRHLMQFIGGQGIIIVALTLFANTGMNLGSLYTGEGREEKILPSVVHTARFIWRVALSYFLISTTLLTGTLLLDGLPPAAALYHAVNLFMAAFDTGGYAIMSTSVAYYRSPAVEAVLTVVMVAGAFSFALHHQLWQRRGRELLRNLETRTIATTTVLLFVVMAIGLGRSGALTEPGPLLRHGFFHLVSAHTTTGLSTVPGRLFVTDWGQLAPAMLVIAMALGGMAGSTAGGIKAMRIGLLLKGLRSDVRRVLLPEHAVIVETYHSTVKRILRPAQVRTAVVFLLLWLGLYLLGAVVGLYYGYDLQLALFESTAAASSGGLSVGVVRPDAEAALKVIYILQMVTGRLEFITMFALAGYLVAMFRGRA
jgi:trk system potassium uptake protein